MHAITARHSFLTDFFVQLFGYREYLKQSVMRDLRKKYKRSALGYLWTMLHPLGMMLIIGTVLSHVMQVPFKDYAIFFLIGLLAWNYFNSTALMSLHSVRANSRLFGQIALPKYIFVMSLVASNFANYLLALAPLFLIMIVAGHAIPWTVVLFPLIVLPLVIVTTGISLILAVANVFFEDTLHLSEVALQALYFLTPVLYSRDRLPPELIKFLVLNPLFFQIEALRDVLFAGVIPDGTTYFLNLVASLCILALGLLVFRRSEDKFLYFI